MAAATPIVVPSSSSSSSMFQWDVFLSFRGEDTRDNFTSHLYAALVRKGIKTFKDDKELKKGELISEALKKAIKESRISIIIYSRNYANSRWCLEELSLIMECWEKNGQKVIPVFLKGVHQLDVQHQKESFGEPFEEHEKNFDQETVEKWRSALRAAAQLSGKSFSDFRDEEKLIKKIVKDVVKDVNLFTKSKKRKQVITPPVTKVPSDAMIENQPSTERMVQQMLEWISNPDPGFGIIGVYGMGGVGKTTLAKEVNNRFEKDLSQGVEIPFETVIMVTVSATPNIPSIQTYLSKRLGLPNASEAESLFNALRKKKFLLILDDVWSKLKLEDIGIPNPRTHSGSKILVTSRSKDACTDMGAKKTIKIHPLSVVESWGLFVEVAGDHVTSNGIKCFARKIVGRCKGLPLAIVTVGRAMANRLGVKEWAGAVRDMELSTTTIRGMKEEVFAPLKFSFDRLENEMLKNLFLYFASFPEDYYMGEYEMLNYWVAEGFVDKYGSLKAARNKGEDLIRSLKIACMVEDGEFNDLVRMHDMMRELALWITASFSSEFDCNSSKFLLRIGASVREAPQAHEWLNATRISFINAQIEEFPELEERCPKLTSWLMRWNWICVAIPPTKFFQHMDQLSILDISHSALKSLPDSLSCLVHLRVLRLRKCSNLRSLPALGKLQLLQVLDLNGCRGLNQPIQEYEWVGGLSNLRCLDVEYSIVSIPVGVIPRLHKLEELGMIDATNIKWTISSAEDEKWDESEPDGRGQKDDQQSIIDVEELSHLTSLTSLTISFEDTIIMDWFKTLANKIKSLELRSCRVVKQGALQVLNESQNLRELIIQDCLDLTCVRISAMYTSIDNCKDLEEVIDGPYCKDLEEVLEGEEVSQQDSIGKYGRRRNWSCDLSLTTLPKLQRICVGLEPGNCFARLGSIGIRNCKSLKIVFTKGMLCMLNNLKYISIEYCKRMEVIIGAEEEEVGEGTNSNVDGGVVVISTFPRLMLLALHDLPALHDVCSNHILDCPLLNLVTINNCRKLKKDPLNIQNRDGFIFIKEVELSGL